MTKNLLLPLIALALFACGETTTTPGGQPTETPAQVQTITIDAADQTELKAAIEADAASTVYHSEEVAFETDGTKWAYGADAGLANASNNAGYAEHNLFQIKSSKSSSNNYIVNTEALAAGYTKATVTFYATYASQAAQYLPVVSEGAAADQLSAVDPVTEGHETDAEGKYVGTPAGWQDGKYEANVYVFEYNLDKTSTFFKFTAGQGALYLASIVLA